MFTAQTTGTKRKSAPALERLEMRSLLSALTYSLSTSQPVYQTGQSVQMTFTETNTSGAPQNVLWGDAGFDVSQNGKVVFSQIIPIAVYMQTLQPGQSLTDTFSWNGQPEVPSGTPLTGDFTFTNFDAPTGMNGSFSIEPAAPTPPTNPSPPITNPNPPITNPNPPITNPNPPITAPTPPITSPTPTPTPTQPISPPTQPITPEPTPPIIVITSPISVSSTSTQPHSQSSRKLPVVVTLKNVSNSDVTLKPHAKAEGVTILDGTTPVWHTRKIEAIGKSRTLHAGQTVRLSVAWNGKPNEPGIKALGAELLTIEVNYGGYTAEGTLQVD
jgi:hypothetical protein